MVTFQEIGLPEDILAGINDLGFETPTPIQEKAIPFLLNSEQDLIGFAQTGTGKTAAFSLPILAKLDVQNKDVQSIILCPTRELCLQIGKDIESFSKHMKGFRYCTTYGGEPIDKQIRSLSRGAQVVVGTPGRVGDLIRRGKLKLGKINWLVLDEADEMLTMGFKDELDAILETTNDQKQTMLFSATMSKEVARIASNYMDNPENIKTAEQNMSSDNVTHQYYLVNHRDRYSALKRIADINPNVYGIVFCRTRMETKDVASQLMADGYNADALHGDLSQPQRDYVMNRFRNRNLQLLIATDVAARGLDVNELTHVINYNLPDEDEVYIHRSGRTGRAGNKGISIAIAGKRDVQKLRFIERKMKKEFTRVPVPNGREVCEMRMFNLMDKVEHAEVNEAEISSFIQPIFDKLENLSKEDLIKRFVSLEFNRFLEYYKNAPDLNVDSSTKRRKEERDRSPRGRNSNFGRLFINLGTKQNLTPTRLIGLVNDSLRNDSVSIGKIDIQKTFSFFEVDKQHVEDVIKACSSQRFDNLRISVEAAQSRDSAERRQPSREKRNTRGTSSDRDRNSGSGRRRSGGGEGHRGRRNKK